MSNQRLPGHHAGLSKTMVVEAASLLMAEKGVAALSIRQVAHELGVVPNALYGWVRNKEALLDAVVDEALAGTALISETSDAARITLALFDALVTHPDLIPLAITRGHAPGANADTIREGLLRDCQARGFLPPDALSATIALMAMASGFAALATSADRTSKLAADGDHRAVRLRLTAAIQWITASAGDKTSQPIDDA